MSVIKVLTAASLCRSFDAAQEGGLVGSIGAAEAAVKIISDRLSVSDGALNARLRASPGRER